MNKWIGCGRLTADPEVAYTTGQNPMAIAKYRLAVERKIKREGQQNADFINCTAIGKNGEFVERYLKKGMKIIVEGRIQTGSYKNKDGVTIYTTEVVVEGHEFCESKKQEPANSNSAMDDIPSGFGQITDDEVPF